jgi:enterochelin esterase-like enzyme
MKTLMAAIKKRNRLSLIFLALSIFYPLQAQLLTRNTIISPQVLPDNTVTFRLYAPTATNVSISGEWTQDNRKQVQMVRNDTGLWVTTTGPLKPEFYSYSFLVEGVSVIDPSNPRVLRDGSRYSSLLIVPGEVSDKYIVKDVAHGTLSKVWYDSPSLKLKRRMFVYTPAGYEDGTQKYPVLYLLHGGGGDEEQWSTLGRTVEIMDNLISGGTVKPMIVVMPNGNANQSESVSENMAVPSSPIPGAPSSGLFESSLVKDIIPFIESKYRVLNGKDNRAIAGLSMGGGQTFNIGMKNIDTFSWIGVFSSGMFGGVQGGYPAFDPEKLVPGLLTRSDSFNKSLKLFYISVGLQDPRYGPTQKAISIFRDNKLNVVSTSFPGDHCWAVWRLSLCDFAPMLFKGKN